jgi:hypothetical protein
VPGRLEQPEIAVVACLDVDGGSPDPDMIECSPIPYDDRIVELSDNSSDKIRMRVGFHDRGDDGGRIEGDGGPERAQELRWLPGLDDYLRPGRRGDVAYSVSQRLRVVEELGVRDFSHPPAVIE